MSATTSATMTTTSGPNLVARRISRRRLSAPHAPRTVSLANCTHFPPSVAALDLSTPSSAPILASLRVLVLSHLAELETSLAHSEVPSKESLKTIGEERLEEARTCAREGLEMLRRIRDDVYRHFPELPFDAASMEKLLRSHLYDLSSVSYPGIVSDIRSHLPELPQLRPGISVSESVLAEMQSKLEGVRSHMYIPDVHMPLPLELSIPHPLEYLPTLSSHLQSLHAHLSSLHAPELSWPSFPSRSYHIITDLLDKVLSSDLLPNLPTVLHRLDDGPGAENSLEKAAREVKAALTASLNGSRLVRYEDLPMEWRNNHFVKGGYRFIPLNKWHVILLSLFALHNETLNIHTHMIPFLHTLISLVPALNYSSVPIDAPERMFTVFAQVCLFTSAIWHTMAGCAHRKGMEFCARVDYVGIGWLISASIGSIVYYGFSCHEQAAWFYLSLCFVNGILGSVFPFMKWFNMRKYKKWRVAFFLGLAFTGLAPLAHLCFLYGPVTGLRFIAPISTSLASYVTGLVFYVSHIPERFFAQKSSPASSIAATTSPSPPGSNPKAPNRLHQHPQRPTHSHSETRWIDYIGGGSHAIWHLFIVLAIYLHRTGMRELRGGVGGTGCLAF